MSSQPLRPYDKFMLSITGKPDEASLVNLNTTLTGLCNSPREGSYYAQPNVISAEYDGGQYQLKLAKGWLNENWGNFLQACNGQAPQLGKAGEVEIVSLTPMQMAKFVEKALQREADGIQIDQYFEKFGQYYGILPEEIQADKQLQRAENVYPRER